MRPKANDPTVGLFIELPVPPSLDVFFPGRRSMFAARRRHPGDVGTRWINSSGSNHAEKLGSGCSGRGGSGSGMIGSGTIGSGMIGVGGSPGRGSRSGGGTSGPGSVAAAPLALITSSASAHGSDVRIGGIWSVRTNAVTTAVGVFMVIEYPPGVLANPETASRFCSSLDRV